MRHHLEAAVLRSERALGLVNERQGDQVEAQAAHLEEVRDRLDDEADASGPQSD